MTNHQDALLGFGIIVCSGAAATAAMGWTAIAGYFLGIVTTFVGAMIVSMDLE